MNLNDGLSKVSDLREKLKQFISSDNILGTLSGVTIAIAAGKMITSFVSEIIFPSIYYILKYKSSGEFSPINSESISRFGKEFISFLFVVIITFIFVKYVLEFMFDIKGKPLVKTSTAAAEQASAQQAPVAQQASAQQTSAPAPTSIITESQQQTTEKIYMPSSVKNEGFFGGNYASF